MSKHQSAQFQNQLFSLNPEWDKGFDMDLPGTKPRFQAHTENGVLFLRYPQGTASPVELIFCSQSENKKCHTCPSI